MISDLIFIRHGKAAVRNDEQDDALRELTAKGKDELKKSMSSLHLLLKADQAVRLWSSPKLRARQTAKIIAASLPVKEIVYFDFIGSGDFNGLCSELEKIAEPAAVVIVGHDPYLSDWSEKISGFSLPYKKGAAAGFKIDALSPLSGEVQWLIQPKTLQRIGRESEAGNHGK